PCPPVWPGSSRRSAAASCPSCLQPRGTTTWRPCAPGWSPSCEPATADGRPTTRGCASQRTSQDRSEPERPDTDALLRVVERVASVEPLGAWSLLDLVRQRPGGVLDRGADRVAHGVVDD